MTPLRALFIDDCIEDAELEAHELQRGGFEVAAHVVQTREALALALRQSWDVVLCDWNMPGLDAPSALKLVQATGADVPFLIVSGSVGEEIAAGAMRAGAHDYILKQNLARLGAAVDRELREARIRRERREAVAALEQSFQAKTELVQELEAALRARDEFLTVASHELKTPITALVLQVERLRRLAGVQPGTSSELVELLPAIDRQAKRLTELIHSVLDVAQLQSGHLALSDSEVDLVEVVREAAGPFAELQKSLGGSFELDLPAALQVHTDRARVGQLVSHLCSNAVKYGESKPVRVELAREERRAMLRVVDHGLGIAPEDLERIFARFERAVPDRAFWGIGLGLWIARQIAEALGGAIRVESEPARGSTFTVELPLRRDT